MISKTSWRLSMDACQLFQEAQEAPPELRAFIGEAIRTGLLAASRFQDALPGYLPPMRRAKLASCPCSAKLDALSKMG